MESELSQHQQKCQFISKVYNTLIFQLSIMTTMILTSMIPTFQPFMMNYISNSTTTCFLISMMSELIILGYYNTLSDTSINGLLLLFTLSMSTIVTHTTLYFPPTTVLLSILTTLVIVFVLNCHATTTSYKYSIYNSLCVSILMAMVINSLLSYYYGFGYESIISSMLGSLLFSVFIVIDTQKLTEDNYYLNMQNGHIVMSLTLFLDIVNLFIRVLKIMNSLTKKESKKDKK